MKKIVLLAAVAGTASAAFAQNSGFRLTDGTAVYDITGTGTSGTIPTSEPTSAFAGQVSSNFRVSGGTSGSDNLFANWWWYRDMTPGAASTRELAVRQSTGTAVRTSSAANQVTYVITTNATESFTLSFLLNQTSATTAVINMTCTVTNNAPGARDFDLINYADYFLANADAGDRLDAGYGPGTGVIGTRVMNFSDSGAAGWGMSHWGFNNTNAWATGLFSAIGGQIVDSSLDVFADGNLGAPVNPAVGADIGGLMQFRFTGVAGGGGTATASSAIIVWNAAPTPGAAGLMGLGMLAASRRRRV